MSEIKQDRAIRVARRLCLAAIAASATAAVAPALANASTLWVSPKPVKAPFNSCANPGYNSVQQAINVNASPITVHVCNGTYAEQLVIEKEATIVGAPGATVQLPASPANSTTPCTVFTDEQTEVEICGAVKVSISNLKIEALWPAGTCKEHLYGVFVGGGANLVATNSTIRGAGASTINGCQGGIGVEIGKKLVESGRTPQVGSARLTGDQISAYQKNGINVLNAGSSATVKGVTVTGAGPTPEIAQNGIEVGDGASATISSSTVTGNECNHTSCGENALTQSQSTGVLFIEAKPGSSVTGSKISENDIGVYHFSGTETNKPQATIASNTMESDRYESVVLDQGFAAVNKNKMRKGNVGIMLIQYAGPEPQAFGPRGTGTGDTISEMTRFAIEGLSDKAPSDQFGSFTISSSKISNNPPGATVSGSVFTNNPEKLKIFTNGSDK